MTIAKLLVSASLLATAAVSVPSVAAVVTPVSVTASSTFIFSYQPQFLIDGSGLTAGIHDGNFLNHWMSETTGVPAYLVFDLGQTYMLTEALIWQYNVDFGLDRGVRDLTVSVSSDAVNYQQIGAGTLVQANGVATAAQTVSAVGTGRYVRLDLLNNYGDQFTWTGLAEVRFTGAVPEASTWAMLIAGFGFVGSALRRRRAVAA